MNKKEKQLAIKSALSDKVLNNSLIVVDEIKMDEYKTKTAVAMLKAIGAGKKALVVLDENNVYAVNSLRNIPGVVSAQTNTINTYDIVNADTLVITKAAVAKLEEVYA